MAGLRNTKRQIEESIQKILIKKTNRKINKIVLKLDRALFPLLETAIFASPEIQSLSNGVLRAEFGLEFDPSQELVSAIMSSFSIVPIYATKKTPGRITINLQPADYANVLGSSFAFQEIKGGVIPWLEWLLLLGDTIIVADFGVQFGSFPYSRSGMARMSKNFKPYKVDSRYSGTEDDNFITRAIDSVLPELRSIILGVL